MSDMIDLVLNVLILFDIRVRCMNKSNISNDGIILGDGKVGHVRYLLLFFGLSSQL